MGTLETAMITKILVGAGILFVIAYLGNMLSFSNRFVNALVTAIVFAVIYGAMYFAIDQAALPPELSKLSQETWLQMIGLSAVLVFVVDLIASMLSFSNRFMSALTTAIVFAVLFGILTFAVGGVPSTPT